MKRLALALAAALVTLAPAVRAQALKIGYVDVQRAVQEVEEGKSARSRLQSELAERKAQLDQKRVGIEKLKGDFDKQAAVLSEEAKNKKLAEMQKAYVEAQGSAQQMQEELAGKEQEAMGSISRRMIDVINEVAVKEGFSFVLDKAVLLYAPNAADVTNEVVRRYNDKYPVGAAAAAAPAGKKHAGPAAPAPAAPKK